MQDWQNIEEYSKNIAINIFTNYSPKLKQTQTSNPH